jgi:hypothetical protein
VVDKFRISLCLKSFGMANSFPLPLTNTPYSIREVVLIENKIQQLPVDPQKGDIRSCIYQPGDSKAGSI